MRKFSTTIVAAILISGCTDAPGTAAGVPTAEQCGYVTPAFATDMYWAINNARQQGRVCGGTYFEPVPALAFNCQLTTAAQQHTNDMDAYNVFSHTGSNGLQVGNRVANTGYQATYVAENIALGTDNPYSTVNAWLASSGHCQNIMSRTATEFGVGYSNGTIGANQHIWTVVFGDR